MPKDSVSESEWKYAQKSRSCRNSSGACSPNSTTVAAARSSSCNSFDCDVTPPRIRTSWDSRIRPNIPITARASTAAPHCVAPTANSTTEIAVSATPASARSPSFEIRSFTGRLPSRRCWRRSCPGSGHMPREPGRRGSSETDSRLRCDAACVEHDLGRARELLEVVGLVSLEHHHHVRAGHCGVEVGFAGDIAALQVPGLDHRIVEAEHGAALAKSLRHLHGR